MKNKKKFLNPLLLLLGTAALVLFVVFDLDAEAAENAIRNMNPLWLVGVAVCMAGYYCLDAEKFRVTAAACGCPRSFGESFLVSLLGFFYSAVTPLASGGQPFQVYYLHKKGMSTAAATTVIASTYVAYHIGLLAMGLLGLTFCLRDFSQGSALYVALFFLGLVIQLLLVAIALLSAIIPAWTARIGRRLIHWGLKLPVLRKKRSREEELLEKWSSFVEEYHASFTAVRTRKKALILGLLLGFGEIACYMSVAYCVYRGFGFAGEGWFTMMFVQAMLFLAVAFVPLPGASVASEGGFLLIFTRYFGDCRAMGMLVWRLATYYLTLAVGYVCVILSNMRRRRRQDPAPRPDVW